MRQREGPHLINIDHEMDALVNYFRTDRRLEAAYIFGSYGTEHQTPLSDVDLALLVTQGVTISLNDELRLGAEITAITGEEDIDLVILNKVPVTLQYRVISTGKLIYRKDDSQLADFIEKVLKFHGDYNIDLTHFYREYDEHLKEEYLDGRS